MTDAARGEKRGWRLPLLSGLAGGALGALIAVGVMLAAGGPFIRGYLLENPEILPEAIEKLRARETAEAIRPIRAALETPFHGAWAGAEDGDVVLVEFFDYACGYCRASNPVIDRLLREDDRLKVVWREYPVLGPDSQWASLSSLQAAKAGRFKQFHDRLYATAQPTGTAVAAASEAVGLEATREITPEFEAELTRNFELARAIGASGTPTFVVGNQVLHGAVGYRALRDAIAAARQ